MQSTITVTFGVASAVKANMNRVGVKSPRLAAKNGSEHRETIHNWQVKEIFGIDVSSLASYINS